MNAKPVFVYERTHKETRVRTTVLARETLREILVKYPEYRWEQLQRFSLIQDARQKFPQAEALFKKLFTGHSPESKAKIARAKIGIGNPNYHGIPAERKDRIRATIKARDRRQVRNPFFGHKHSPETKARIALSAKRRRFRWAMEPGGKARRVALDFVLPVGWRWGHGGFRYRRGVAG